MNSAKDLPQSPEYRFEEADPAPDAGRQWLAESGCPTDQPLWVFAYGSLMWNPGFAHDAAMPVLLRGYHRRFCVLSYRYRGTPERPGLVLGLDRGGASWGMALRIQPGDLPDGVDYLWQREMVGGVYKPVLVPLRIQGARQTGLTFRVRRQHRQYCDDRCLDAAARIIAASHGPSGSNRDYLYQTLAHLDRLGIHDRMMRELWQRVQRLEAASSDSGTSALMESVPPILSA